jgi:hypothetical protein
MLDPTTVWITVEELRALRQHVRVDGPAQVCGHPFADPTHHEKARGRENAERHGNDKKQAEIFLHHGEPLHARQVRR